MHPRDTSSCGDASQAKSKGPSRALLGTCLWSQKRLCGRFELERDGPVATLQYTVAGNVLALLHSEIPESLRGSGIASTLAQTALDWVRANHMKVDVVCPFVAAFLET